jgi:hypothetical protein
MKYVLAGSHHEMLNFIVLAEVFRQIGYFDVLGRVYDERDQADRTWLLLRFLGEHLDLDPVFLVWVQPFEIGREIALIHFRV